MKWSAFILFCLLPVRALAATTDQSNPLYQQSIRATKQNIARETLEVFYRDALDYYHDRHYDQAMELLDKIYSVDPHYEDVQALRLSIQKIQMVNARDDVMVTVNDLMKQGKKSYEAGLPVLAISYWKKALDAYPGYAPAAQKIQEVNHQLAQKQFEIGYFHYHHGEFEDAMEAWQNAIALDPSYKQRGLLLLMSKVEQNVRKGQVSRLAAQAFEQYQDKNYEQSLASYQELLSLEPRHEEARRMSAKIRIMLGQTAYKEALASRQAKRYAEAIPHFETAVLYGYEVPASQKAIAELQAILKKPPEPKVVRRPKPAVVKSTAAAAAPAAPPVPAAPVDPVEALNHYRQGMSAIRSKDYHRAIEELKVAWQLDPSNEHIYNALQRAQAEWNASQDQPASAGNSAPATPNP